MQLDPVPRDWCLGARLLQVRDSMNCGVMKHQTVQYFTSKSLFSAEWHYRHTECQSLRIPHGLGKFHHYCFMKEVCLITDQKPLVAILSKDVAILSQWLQCIMPRIHQYRVYIISIFPRLVHCRLDVYVPISLLLPVDLVNAEIYSKRSPLKWPQLVSRGCIFQNTPLNRLKIDCFRF